MQYTHLWTTPAQTPQTSASRKKASSTSSTSNVGRLASSFYWLSFTSLPNLQNLLVHQLPLSERRMLQASRCCCRTNNFGSLPLHTGLSPCLPACLSTCLPACPTEAIWFCHVFKYSFLIDLMIYVMLSTMACILSFAHFSKIYTLMKLCSIVFEYLYTYVCINIFTSVPIGVYEVWQVVLDVNLHPRVSQETAGWMDFYATLGGCVAGLLVSRLEIWNRKLIESEL